MKQLNIWLKATFIHDVLKCLSTDDKDAKSLFNGFENVIADGELAEVRLEPNGANICLDIFLSLNKDLVSDVVFL